MPKVLLVDNEASILSVLSTLMKAEGYEIIATREGDKARDILCSDSFDLMISDIRMKPIDGMALLKAARSEQPKMSVIMLTAHGTIETAIEAMKLGAFDYVTKPFKVDELLITVQRALDYRQALSENQDLKSQLKTKYQLENIVAESPAMREVCGMIERVAPTETTVLIYGESGTGKEVVAKAIHAYSHRKGRKFLAVNCAALPEALLESEMFGHVKGAFTGASANKAGLFEAVEDGTIFLDEIGAMPLSIQGKLLRVLQEKEIRRVGGNTNIPVNARVVAATNVKIEELMRESLFREDLYYRLNVIPVTIAPLRDRRADIMPLVQHVIRQEIGDSRQFPTITTDTRAVLEAYAWPGNVRELENAIKHALTFARDNRLTSDILPARILNAVGDMSLAAEDLDGSDFDSLKSYLRKKEREYLAQVINVMGGDKEKAAKALKISLATLYRKIADDPPVPPPLPSF